MDPQQNQNQNNKGAEPRKSQPNVVPHNLPVKKDEEPLKTPAPTPTSPPVPAETPAIKVVKHKKVSQEGFPTLEQQTSPTSTIHSDKPDKPNGPSVSSTTDTPTPPPKKKTILSNLSKITLPKKAQASSYGKTIIKSLRTFAEDVAEARKRKGIPQDEDVEKKEEERKEAAAKEAEAKKKEEEAEQKKAEKEVARKKEVEEKATRKAEKEAADKTTKEDARLNKEAEEEALRKAAEGEALRVKALERESIRKKAIESELAESGIHPTKEKEEKPVEAKTSISPIKTFRSDAQAEVKESNLSVIKIATAQNKKRVLVDREQSSKRESHFVRNLLAILLSLILLGSGSGITWFFYQKSVENSTVTPEAEIPSLVFADTLREIDVTGIQSDLLDAIQIKNTTEVGAPSSDIIRHLYIVETALDTSVELGIQTFLSRVSSNIPNRLVRSLSPEYMLGRHKLETGESPFLILKTDSFENTFASMLEWESTMQKDLAPYFGEALGIITASPASTRGTSTPQAQIIIPRIFHDVIIKNIDTRLLRDDGGDIALLYAFPNANTLIITTNEDTFFEVFRRLSNSR